MKRRSFMKCWAIIPFAITLPAFLTRAKRGPGYPVLLTNQLDPSMNGFRYVSREDMGTLTRCLRDMDKQEEDGT